MSWKTDHYHAFLSGATGSGKTSLAHEVYCTTGRTAIFWNVQYEEIKGKVVHSPAELLQELAKGNEAINYVPNGVDSSALEEEFAQVIELLFRLGQRVDAAILLVIDEAHELSASLQRAVKRGRRWGIKCLVLSQEPRKMDHSALTQMKYHIWVGKPSKFEKNYFKTYGMDYERLSAQPEHGYLVMDTKGEVIEERPGGADSRYLTGS